MKKIICAIILAVCAGVRSFPAASPVVTPPAAAQPAVAKTHLLFMGLDLDWQQGTASHRVSAIRGRAAVVGIDGRERQVRMGQDNKDFKLVNSLKLGKPTVRLDQVKLDRFYTAGNDPQNRFMEAFALSTAAMDEGMVARQLSMRDQYFPPSLTPSIGGPEYDPDYEAKRLAARETEMQLNMVNVIALDSFTQTRAMPTINPTPPGLPNPKSGSVALGLLKIEETDVALPAKSAGPEAAKAQPSAGPEGETSATLAPGAEPLAPPVPGPATVEVIPVREAKPTMISDNRSEWCDALELKFDVSSEKLLADPYVVIVLSYIDPLKPQEPRQWVHALQLEPVGPTPRQVRVRHGGFPPGFLPKQPSIHVYDRGRELATTTAGGMALTRDQAMEYLVVDYLSMNKKATLAASPIPASFPEDMVTRLQATQFPKEVFVQVNAKGIPIEMFADAGRRRRIDDPGVRATIAEMRFGPALEKGKPIEGVARLAFSERQAVVGK